MKLLQINSVYPDGSTGKICRQIDKEFKRAKLGESRIAFFLGGGLEGDDAIRCSSYPYSKMMALKSRITGDYGFVSKRSTKKLISVIEGFSPDVIHLHNVHDHAIDLEKLFNYLEGSNAELVWTFHDCWAYTGYCAHYTLEQCDKWISNCASCPIWHRYSWITDKSNLLQDRKKNLYGRKSFNIITPSEWLAKEVKKSFLGGNRITVINNGIDLSVFRPTPSDFKKRYSIENKRIILGVAYQWNRRKGFDVFVQLSGIIEDHYVIVLVGNIQRSIPLPSNIIVITRTTNQNELAEIYTAADVFLNPTREEVFGLVNIEALACGTPVITFNSGGSPECIDESCGIVTDNDLDKVYSDIIEVCENYRFNSEDCLARAKKFDTSRMCVEYIGKYLEFTRDSQYL